MPSTCCVPGCKANYQTQSETVKVFQFPSDELLKKEWMKRIPRKDWVPTKRSAVCIKHFRTEDVITEDSVKRPDGSILTVKRKHYKLCSKAVPCIFENLPKYLSDNKPSTSRKDPTIRHSEFAAREESKIEEFLAEDFISSFEDLKNYSVKRDHWCCVKQECKVTFYKIDVASEPIYVTSSFVIKNDLTIDIFLNQSKTPVSSFSWLLNGNKGVMKINRWSQLENLFPFIENAECCDISLQNIINLLYKFIEQEEIKRSDDIILHRTKFLTEQLSLSCKKPNARRYSPELLAWAFTLYTNSPTCYQEMYSSGSIILPHKRNLVKVSSFLQVSGKNGKNFLKEKAEKLEPYELFVNLLLDEIMVKPYISYDSGKITGFSQNKQMQKASSIQCFMLSSLYSSNKDVIGLIPVRNLTAKELLPMTQSAIKSITEAGFKIISVISDNNRINRNMLTELCGGVLKSRIENPWNLRSPLFLLFDSVHILKSIRNNWINQKNDEVSFIFPNPEDHNDQLVASFENLRSLHMKEKSFVVKNAPRLNENCLYPSSVERQNVSLCLRIFHESTICGLKIDDNDKNRGTILFLEIISKWWKIANIKNVKKGYEKRDSDCMPFSSSDDERLQFLTNCSIWLKKWQDSKIPGMRRTQGKLTSETFFAFYHTLITLKEIIIYLISEKNDKYVLTATFQTDDLEGRFGQYRQLNGGNHSLSVDQVLKSEKKLRLSSLLKLHSECYGEIPITNFLVNFSEKENVDDTNSEDLELKGFCHLNTDEDDIPSAIYISGYAVHQLKKKLSCRACEEMLSSNRELLCETNSTTVNYFTLVDRGGLTYPSKYIAEVFLLCLKVFQCILRKDNEYILLHNNVKNLLLKLVSKEVQEMDREMHCSTCGRPRTDLAVQCISIFLNIFLNNYTKIKNDVSHTASYKRKYDVLLCSNQT